MDAQTIEAMKNINTSSVVQMIILGVIAVSTVMSAAKESAQGIINKKLRRKIRKMKEKPLRHDGQVLRDNDGIPYCPGCFDDKNKFIHLTALQANTSGLQLLCPVCKADFNIGTFSS